jgi:hypothetical protein
MGLPGFTAEFAVDRSADRPYRTRGERRPAGSAVVVPQIGSGRAGTVCVGTVLHTLYVDDVPNSGPVLYVGEAIGSCPRPTSSRG